MAGLGAWFANPRQGDFSLYYSAAVVGRTEGWQYIYDMPRFLAEELRVAGSHALFLSTPPLAWLVIPLTLLPYIPALVIWEVLETVALLGAVYLALDSGVRWRWALTAILALGFVPAFIALEHGQATLLVALALSAGVSLLRKGHQLRAGSVLALICLKPQLGLLVPVALLLSGRRRAGLACLAGMAALAAASVLSLGEHGLASYLNAISYTFTHDGSYLHFNTLTGHLGALWGALASVLVLAVAFYTARRSRRGGVELGVLAAVTAGMCVTNYLLIYDYTVLMIAGLAALNHRAGRPLLGFLALAYLIADFQNLVYPLPVMLITEVLLLGLLAAAARREGDRDLRSGCIGTASGALPA